MCYLGIEGVKGCPDAAFFNLTAPFYKQLKSGNLKVE